MEYELGLKIKFTFLLRRQVTTNMNFQTTAERGRAGTTVDITVTYKNRRQVEDNGCEG